MSLLSTADLRVWMGITAGDNAPNEKLKSIAAAIEKIVETLTNKKKKKQQKQ